MAVLKINLYSELLRGYTNVTCILPDGDRPRPVLWLLHGGSGDQDDYLHFTRIAQYAEETGIAIVCPADYNAFYSDDDDTDGLKYYEYVTCELPSLCIGLLPLSNKREDNAVAGLSMGGDGALRCALGYPENYAHALVMSCGIRGEGRFIHPVIRNMRFEEEGALHRSPICIPKLEKSRDFNAIRGTQLDLAYLARRNAEQQRPLPRMIFASGGADRATYNVVTAMETLAPLGYDISVYITPGYTHQWDYWDMTLKRALYEWLPLSRNITEEK